MKERSRERLYWKTEDPILDEGTYLLRQTRVSILDIYITVKSLNVKTVKEVTIKVRYSGFTF